MMTIAHLVIDSVFFGFAVYSLILVLARLYRSFNVKPGAHFDYSATLLLSIAGIIYPAIWLINFYMVMPEDQNRLVNRMFGPYWYGFRMYPVTYLGVSQLFWIQKMRNSKAYRTISSIILLFVISYEKIVIIVTSLHHDFLPGHWANFELTFNIFLSWLVKIGLFALAFFLTDVLVSKRKKAR